ncbi:folate-binding protein YgfZ [Leptothrix cholodnii SP-6]|uniref:Folate-binding protein YgfZ n=1 Tax=Leptothrix cholodnii (strain ATCC 51168 / LMG 8142 / SP-6) TaxID=395495 RepID=B1Y016_LEPCP|nr:folate-binding protein YgfZ [Leptothrix cholodnii]ACB34143.1 folate-binding protein YgfZ [Leptothrix cholodnii SP-6]
MNSTHLLPSGACRLPFWGVMRASGADAVSFLHSQLSNDVTRLDTGHARLAAYCNAQGRMLASLLYAKRSAEEVWLLCSADLLPVTLKRLSMFVLRAKARLSDASGELAVLGLAGQAGADWLGADAPAGAWDKSERDGAMHVRLPDVAGVPRWLWIGPAAAAEAVLQALPVVAESDWQWLDVSAGIAPVVAATSGQFVPQMLNYELVGGVDFKKGCYPGQEVVARSQYLGKLKRRAFLLASDVPAQPAQEVFWSGDTGQPAGQVAWSATAPDGSHLALAELKIGVIGSGSLHLGSGQGPQLRVQPLPYALPHEASSGEAA